VTFEQMYTVCTIGSRRHRGNTYSGFCISATLYSLL